MAISMTGGNDISPKNTATNTFDKIQELKRILTDAQVNEAVRRYNFILKTLNTQDFQVNMENSEFYMIIFHQALLEQKIYNIKGLS